MKINLRFLFSILALLAVFFVLVGNWIESSRSQAAAIKKLRAACSGEFGVTLIYYCESQWFDEKGRYEWTARKSIPKRGLKGYLVRTFGVDSVCTVRVVKFIWMPPNAIELVKNLGGVGQIEILTNDPAVLDKWKSEFPNAVVLNL